MNSVQLIGAIQLGLIYGLVSIGVYLTFRLIDFPDLTVDGTFSLGAAIAASLIASGKDPYLATLMAILGGGLAGCATAYLNVKCKILGLLAGILTMTALYSINLRIMGRANISLLGEVTIFSLFSSHFIIIGLFVFIVLVLLSYLVYTELGLAIRAIGVNKKMCQAQGVCVGGMVVLALVLSNAIVAGAGALFAQAYGFADISLGQGSIIVGLAAVIIGEAIFRTRNIILLFIGCIVGSILYRIAVAFALNAGDLGLKASDMKLITALLIALTMSLSKLKRPNHLVK